MERELELPPGDNVTLKELPLSPTSLRAPIGSGVNVEPAPNLPPLPPVMPKVTPIPPPPIAKPEPKPEIKVMPAAPHSNVLAPLMPGAPSKKHQSWGAVISIVIIVLMVVVGAFYAWGERIAEERALQNPPAWQ